MVEYTMGGQVTGLCREVALWQRCLMCGGIHYGEVEGLVSVERWPCSRGA